jgi:hypothetical protein
LPIFECKKKAGQRELSGFSNLSATPELCVTVLYSLSSGLFRFQSLHGITKQIRKSKIEIRKF